MKKYVIILVFALNSHLHAVTYYFAGNLLQDWGSYLAGTEFNGSLSYEHPQAPTELSPFGTSSRFSATNISISIGLENVVLTKDPNIATDGILMLRNPSVFQVALSGDYSLSGWQLTSLGVILTDNSGALYPSVEELPAILNSNDFDQKEVYFGGTDNSQNSVGASGIITSLVPEPSALSLLAVGLGGLAILRRRRS